MVNSTNCAYGRVVDGTFRHFPSFLRLFRNEFDELLDERHFHSVFYANAQRYIPDVTYRAIRRQAQERNFDLNIQPPTNKLDDKAKLNYFKGIKMISDEHHEFWYWFQDQLLNHVNNNEAIWLAECLKGKPEPQMEFGREVQRFDLFFTGQYPKIVDWIVDLIHVESFVDYLSRMNIAEYDDRILECYVKPMMENKPWDHHYWACELLRRIFYAKPGVVLNKQRSWYWDFMYACSQHESNVYLLHVIDPDYRKGLSKYVYFVEKKVTELLTDDMQNYVDENAFFSTEFRPQKLGVEAVIFDEHEDAARLELRSYQKELARHANSGINTLICAPTGAGKTIVATDIIVKHFERNLNEFGQTLEKSRVVFIVPSVPLVVQQQKLIKKYVSNNLIVEGFYGGDGRNANERLGSILKAHIIVITPQLLVNMLKSVFKTERLYVSDFTLMVFDECHHCSENHAYHICMQLVTAYKEHIQNKPNAQSPPQIVGLTASLGTGKSTFYTNPTDTENHMLRLCVRMMAEQISTVHSADCLEELERYVNPPIDTIESVKRPEKDAYYEYLSECVKTLGMELQTFIRAARERVEDLKEFRLPDKVDQTFINAVERLYESCGRWPQDLIDSKRLVMTIIDNLRIYLHAVRMNDLLPAQFAASYVQKKMIFFIRSLEQIEEPSEEERRIKNIIIDTYEDRREYMEGIAKNDTGENKQILKTLIRILDEEYTKNPETRTMIFVEQRATTHALATFLSRSRQMEKHYDENSVRSLTSTNQSSKLGGMSNALQKAIIKNFTKGLVKTLVVTSVAEEGMDISACNLIIKYNVVGSERTLIQRRGRARALNSRSVLLALDNLTEQREIENINRERMMHTCLKNLQSKSEHQLRALINTKRKEMEIERSSSDRQMKERYRAFNDNLYDVKCLQCDYILCQSIDFRVINDAYFVCVKSSIWSNISIGLIDSPQAPSANGIAATCSPFTCKKCRKPLGTVINLSSVFLPAFSCGNLVFAQTKGGNEVRRNCSWKFVMDNLFIIEQCNQENLLSMAPTLQNANAEDYQKMREQLALAIQIQIEAIKRKRQRKNRFALAEYEEEE
ncbi:Type III restriction enzyme [Aphelenchoides besseyi]|nr:Type III restriction enzyme [Aphelenchoides besseyi]